MENQKNRKITNSNAEAKEVVRNFAKSLKRQKPSTTVIIDNRDLKKFDMPQQMQNAADFRNFAVKTLGYMDPATARAGEEFNQPIDSHTLPRSEEEAGLAHFFLIAIVLHLFEFISVSIFRVFIKGKELSLLRHFQNIFCLLFLL